MFLTDNLWKIFEVAREERTDGDNFEGDMTTADDLFVKAIEGTEHYACLDKYDMEALKAEKAEAKMAEAKAEYDAVVNSNPDRPSARKYKELYTAFTAGDVEAFEKAKAEGVAEYAAYLESKKK